MALPKSATELVEINISQLESSSFEASQGQKRSSNGSKIYDNFLQESSNEMWHILKQQNSSNALDFFERSKEDES